MVKISIKYAILCGVFLTMIFHVSNFLGSNPLIDVSHLIFDLILFGLFVFFAEKEFKTYHNDGIMHFWQGMTMGFLVYGIGTLIFALLLLAYFYFDPDSVINYQESATKFLSEKADLYKEQFGEDGYQSQLERIKETTSWNLITSASMKKLLAGFFITPVISIILRKQPK